MRRRMELNGDWRGEEKERRGDRMMSKGKRKEAQRRREVGTLNTGQERLKRRGEMRTVEEKAEGGWPHLAPYIR